MPAYGALRPPAMKAEDYGYLQQYHQQRGTSPADDVQGASRWGFVADILDSLASFGGTVSGDAGIAQAAQHRIQSRKQQQQDEQAKTMLAQVGMQKLQEEQALEAEKVRQFNTKTFLDALGAGRDIAGHSAAMGKVPAADFGAFAQSVVGGNPQMSDALAGVEFNPVGRQEAESFVTARAKSDVEQDPERMATEVKQSGLKAREEADARAASDFEADQRRSKFDIRQAGAEAGARAAAGGGGGGRPTKSTTVSALRKELQGLRVKETTLTIDEETGLPITRSTAGVPDAAQQGRVDQAYKRAKARYLGSLTTNPAHLKQPSAIEDAFEIMDGLPEDERDAMVSRLSAEASKQGLHQAVQALAEYATGY